MNTGAVRQADNDMRGNLPLETRTYDLGTLPDFASCRYAPGTCHHAIPQDKRFVVHIHASADVIGDDREDFPNIKLVG
jgi:hypothetical protein